MIAVIQWTEHMLLSVSVMINAIFMNPFYILAIPSLYPCHQNNAQLQSASISTSLLFVDHFVTNPILLFDFYLCQYYVLRNGYHLQ